MDDRLVIVTQKKITELTRNRKTRFVQEKSLNLW